MQRQSGRGGSRLGCLTGLVIVAAVFYLGLPVARAYWRYVQYRSAMQEEIRFRGDQTDARLRTRLRALADSLGLPEDAGVVTISRQNRVVTIQASYEEVWTLAGMERLIHFEPRASGVDR